jgi:hypothetical protein
MVGRVQAPGPRPPCTCSRTHFAFTFVGSTPSRVHDQVSVSVGTPRQSSSAATTWQSGKRAPVAEPVAPALRRRSRP